MQKRFTAAVSLVALSVGAPVLAQNAAVTVQVDANANRHAIKPEIYGVAYANATTLSDLNVVLNRYGGNPASRYNWQLNADNRGADWFFESIAYSSTLPAATVDTLVSDSLSTGGQAMVTVPIMDWVAKVGANRGKLASFSQAKYGAQTNADWQWYADAGNGVSKATGKNIVGNDPNDANTANSPALQQGFVQHLAGKWGTAGNGGVRYYLMDNEPSIWYNTHRDIHPNGATMAEVRDRMIAYGAAVKATDATALVVGPEEWGWSGYLYSGADLQYGAQHGWGSLPDRIANGGMDYVPWLLKELKAESGRRGVNLLDVFSLHYYPQGGEYSNDVSTTMMLRRNRSTRSLWDPNYVDETWIASKVQIIPRMKQWVSTYYPGLPTGITEYNWGAESHISGAIAQADVLGIFGREGLDMAARWTTPAATTPTYKAIKLYRNPDGTKKGFGDTSVGASVPNPDNLSAFAATRASDGALTVMVVSKVLSGNTPVTLNLANFTPAATAQAWQLTSANAITALANPTVTGGAVSLNLPPQSVTLIVVPKGSGTPVPTAPSAPTNLVATGGVNAVNLSWSASASSGVSQYQIWRGTVSGSYALINTIAAGTSYSDTGLASNVTYYYVVRAGNASNQFSGNSNQAQATSQAPSTLVPAPPTNLTATAGSGSVTLNWTASTSTNVTQYRIYRGTSSGVYARIATIAPGTSYTDSGLSHGVTYYYMVRAGNAGNLLSANSNQAQATTL